MTMLYRRKILLNLIARAPNGRMAKLALQKLLFIFCQRKELDQPFDFLPYKFGCFSFLASRDLRVLQNHYGYIDERDDETWQFNHRSITIPQINADDAATMDELYRRFDVSDTSKLIRYVYDAFPYFAIKSKRTLTITQQREVDRIKKELQSQKATSLFTLGYEGISIDRYLNALIKRNIHLLCDVRRNPISMKYGFSKRQLMRYCRDIEVCYVHLPELGIHSSERKVLSSKEDYVRLFANYKKRLGKRPELLDDLKKYLDTHKRIALTCFEREPDHCHRHVVADYLKAVYRTPIAHL